MTVIYFLNASWATQKYIFALFELTPLLKES